MTDLTRLRDALAAYDKSRANPVQAIAIIAEARALCAAPEEPAAPAVGVTTPRELGDPRCDDCPARWPASKWGTSDDLRRYKSLLTGLAEHRGFPSVQSALSALPLVNKKAAHVAPAEKFDDDYCRGYLDGQKDIESKPEIVGLTAALAAPQPEDDRRDAERYRWLRDTCVKSFGMGQDTPAEHSLVFLWQQATPAEAGLTFEAVLDAARTQSEGGEG